jgi:adenylyl cyclase-associated protein
VSLVRELARGVGYRLYVPSLSTTCNGRADEKEPAPAPYVGEMKNAAQFWADRVTKQFKETYVSYFECCD